MGDAKRRGTYEQRVQAAQERQAIRDAELAERLRAERQLMREREEKEIERRANMAAGAAGGRISVIGASGYDRAALLGLMALAASETVIVKRERP